MAQTLLSFSNPINVSAQVGDIAYYAPIAIAAGGSGSGGFNQSGDIYEIGRIDTVVQPNTSFTLPTDISAAGAITLATPNPNMVPGMTVNGQHITSATVISTINSTGQITLTPSVTANANNSTVDWTYSTGNVSYIKCDITPGAGSVPSQGDFIMFAKDNAVNLSSVLGYYAEVTFNNNSREEAELFSIGSDVFESSK